MTSPFFRSDTLNTTTTTGRKSAWRRLTNKLNFFRIHLLFFTFTPLIFSGIFYASNGRYRISYVDSLYNCVSAMTVCGLATINLSSLTPFQQTQLFFLMCVGNPVIVSWVIVYTRRHFFARKFEVILEKVAKKKAARVISRAAKENKPWPHRFVAYMSGRHLSVIDEESADQEAKKEGALRKLRPDMIRRMDDAPKRIDPSGWVSEGRPPPGRRMSNGSIRPPSKPLASKTTDDSVIGSSSNRPDPLMRGSASVDFGDVKPRRRRLSDPGYPPRMASPTSRTLQRFETVADSKPSPPEPPKHFPRTQTVEFAPDLLTRRGRLGRKDIAEHGPLHEESETIPAPMRSGRSFVMSPSVPMSTYTNATERTGHVHRSHTVLPEDSMSRGFGGFPSPFALIKSLIARLFPGVKRTIARTVTMPATMSLTPSRVGAQQGKKQVPYISFDAVVGRNSTFHLLTKDQMYEIGGVEYRALSSLLWIVAAYHILSQLVSFIIIAPYSTISKWKPVFNEQIRPLSPVWHVGIREQFAAFQVVSAYTNTGTSLVDQSMVPFQDAYPMIFVMIFLILAGNTSFPIFLRFMIWCLSKVVRKGSRAHETLHFLLDHPRRCFIYLFPSHQTWFLLTVVLGLTFIDWFFFLVLDLHTPEIASIPVGIRVLDGFIQATAVRAAGFGIVPLAALVPAVQVLYVVMMYISVCNLFFFSVRSTNVYEEQSLGIFDAHEHDVDTFEPSGPRMTVWSRYLGMHARRQLAFDMWWLALSLFVICIIEKNNLLDPLKFGWFNIFRILFELVSAYGTVGLTLGIPNQNYSFSGALHPLSKLIVCLVMLRGRHRGLPDAIDRAIMLPDESEKKDEEIDHRSQFSGNDEPNTQPFAYLEPTSSRQTSDMRRRAPQPSRTFNDDEMYDLEESSSSSERRK
ncbi:cation transport protein-domain-containing protein [Flammula alnicola]|nr:cation transport protein-domain-containing protein [Flammula alnicola]